MTLLDLGGDDNSGIGAQTDVGHHRKQATGRAFANLSTLVIKSGGFAARKKTGKPVFIRRKATGRRASETR